MGALAFLFFSPLFPSFSTLIQTPLKPIFFFLGHPKTDLQGPLKAPHCPRDHSSPPVRKKMFFFKRVC